MVIVRDTREKVGFWNFSQFPECENQITRALQTGDYTIDGYEKKIVIERKKTVSEIAVNLGFKLTQFTREFIRFQDYEKSFVLCEFSLDDVLSFPAKANLPAQLKSKIKMNGKFILKRIGELEKEYHTPFIFCNNKVQAEEMAMEIFKEVVNGEV